MDNKEILLMHSLGNKILLNKADKFDRERYKQLRKKFIKTLKRR